MTCKDILIYIISLATIITIIIQFTGNTINRRREEHGFHRCWIGSSFFDGRYEWRTSCEPNRVK